MSNEMHKSVNFCYRVCLSLEKCGCHLACLLCEKKGTLDTGSQESYQNMNEVQKYISTVKKNYHYYHHILKTRHKMKQK